MKLALLQPQPAGGDAQVGLRTLSAAVRAAGACGADLLVAPELMLPGYNCPEAHRALAQTRDGSWQEVLSGLAREAGCALVTGWSERDGTALFNSVTAFAGTGEVLAHHRKRLLFGEMERTVFQRGTGRPALFLLNGRQVGLLICYEIEFPEPARALAQQGAEVILVPTANPEGFEHVQKTLVPARANENRAFVAYANYCGAENGLAFGGGSVVAGPDGEALARAGQTPALLICELPAISDYPESLLSTQIEELPYLRPDPDD